MRIFRIPSTIKIRHLWNNFLKRLVKSQTKVILNYKLYNASGRRLYKHLARSPSGKKSFKGGEARFHPQGYPTREFEEWKMKIRPRGKK